MLKARVKAKLLGRAETVRVGRFELLRRCGQGGEGVVYEAFDPACERRVALKCLHPSHAATGASLRREFRALSEIVHPNLALLYELFCIGGQWFHTMELLSGTDFAAYVRDDQEKDNGPRFDEPKLRAGLVQLLQGLRAVHAAGRVHRDLKPSNVLVAPGGRVVIVDFGLMIEEPTAAQSSQRKGQPVGTATYMAPEQLRAEIVSSAADLYAVGAILFEALTGRRPRASGTSAGSPPDGVAPTRPSQHSNAIPSDLDALCAELLSEDPARRPTAEQALARLGAHPAVPLRSRRPIRDCFVGRAAQLGALHAAYARSLAGQASCVLVHGESGMGKSALLAKFCSELPAHALVLRGRCYERENTPYKVLDAVVERLVDYLESLESAASLLPRELSALIQVFPAFLRLHAPDFTTHPKDPVELRHRAFSALRELLHRLRQQQAVVLCIDDLQWGDVDSIRVLQQLFAAPEPPALLLVGAYRRSEMHTSPFLRHALVDGNLRHLGWELTDLSVDPLDLDEARALVVASTPGSGAFGQQTADLDARIHEARGVPFVLAAWADDDAAIQSSSPTHAARHVVGVRAAGCSSAARSLLDVLCVAGRPLEISLALQVPQAGPDAWSAAAELCNARLARWRDTLGERCIEPYHDLIREAVAADESSEHVRGIHAAIARGMEKLAMDAPERLVHHLVASGERQRAGHVAVAAGQRASQKLAWDSAAGFLALALELLPESHGGRAALHEQHGEALASAGRHAGSAAEYLCSAGLDQTAGSARLLRRAAQQLMRAGDSRAAVELFKGLMRDAGVRYPHSKRLAFATYLTGRVRQRFIRFPGGDTTQARPPRERERLATLAAVYGELWLVDPVRSLAVHSRFFEEASHARDDYWVQALTWEIALLAVVRGPPALPRMSRLLAEVDAFAVERGQPYDLAVARLARSLCLIHGQHCPRDALPLIREADHLLTTQCSGVHFERSWLALLRDFVLEATGNFAELTETVFNRERECNERENGYTRQQLLFTFPTVMLAQDRPEAALSFLQRCWTPSRAVASVVDFAAVLRSTSALLYSGDAQASFALLDRHWRWLARSGTFRSAPMREMGNFHRGRGAAALYWQSRDPAWKREAERRSRSIGKRTPLARAHSPLLQASLAWADGSERKCRTFLEEAREGFGATQYDTAEWTVRYRLAQLNRAGDDLAAARSWMTGHGIRDPERWAALFVPGPPA